MEIAHGIHVIDRVRGGNVYLLTGARLALIDTGMPGNAPRILDFIGNLGREPAELSHVIITHGHIDHAGSAAELRRLTGAQVVAHRDEVTVAPDMSYVLEAPSSRLKSPILRALSRFGRFQTCPVDLVVADGDRLLGLEDMQVIHTPGHTNGSMCLLLDTQEVLFVGDVIISNHERLSRPLPFGGDREASERSLARLTQLTFDTCCFGHGPPITSHASEMVTRLASSPSGTPLWRRMILRRRDLAGFGVRLWKK